MPRILLTAAAVYLLVIGSVAAKRSPTSVPEIAPIEDEDPGFVGDVDGTNSASHKALEDTVWIADWTFDGASGCTDTGWFRYDNYQLNDESMYWTVNSSFADSLGVQGNAVMLRHHDLCWERDGYPNDADWSVIVKYRGANASVSFRYLSDTEPTYDYVIIEADSGGTSESLVNLRLRPWGGLAEHYRDEIARFDGLNTATATFAAGSPWPGTLPIFGQPTVTHELYIRVTSDGGGSDEDGGYPSRWNAAVVIDEIVVTGDLAYTEDFEGPLDPNVILANTAPSAPFGMFARVYPHITDNDKCTENLTCAWLQSDPAFLARFPNMAFGPGGAVIRNWLDDIYVSPWISLASAPTGTSTLLTFRRFPGNLFSRAMILQGWRVRGKLRIDNTDTMTTGDSIDCLSEWGHAFQYNSLDPFVWLTAFFDMTPFFNPNAAEIQVSFRTVDWQILWGPPITNNPGPGPYVDRVRIGRRTITGPVFQVGTDTRTQAQDCFPTVVNGIAPGEHFSPAGDDIFGTCAFSSGADLGIGEFYSPNLVTGDSIFIANVVDARGAGGVNLLQWYAAITAGPHAGKAPAPYAVGPGGFFAVQPDSCRDRVTGAPIHGAWFVDLDDSYFRGGDRLQYFWYAGDERGGRSSAPAGVGASLPENPAAAELATGGLYEVNFLPTMDWDASYRARIAADPHGDLDPTPAELLDSTQRNCILYYQHTASSRRSGAVNRTSFMYTLDRLGYEGAYDVYDVQGYGNTNNQLAGRANVGQCARYALVIEDDQRSNLVPNIPTGDPANRDTEKLNQAQWYRDYLAQGATGPAGVATLWIIGESTALPANPLFTTDMGLASLVGNQGLSINPNVTGAGDFTFTGGGTASFEGDLFSLNGGCPSMRNYDAASSAGTAVVSHRYTAGSAVGAGAVILNKNAAFGWNTIWMGFGWFDIRDPFGAPPYSTDGTPDLRLGRKLLSAALPLQCRREKDPTATDDPDGIAAPRVTALHANVPNPFNPTTTIRFDLAQDTHVKLQVFDVAGHRVKLLVDATMQKGFSRTVTWDGLDEMGRRVPSGVYFIRLETGDHHAARKMVMLQ